MRERCVFLHGFSKAFAMTGFRIGYACAPAPLTDAMMKIHQYAILCANTMAQDAAIEALEHGARDVEAMRREYEQRRNYIVRGLQRPRPRMLQAARRVLRLPEDHQHRADQPRVFARPAARKRKSPACPARPSARAAKASSAAATRPASSRSRSPWSASPSSCRKTGAPDAPGGDSDPDDLTASMAVGSQLRGAHSA